ncbi:MAG: phosphatase PAP2 family protein [Gemmatimonadales bacterium]
MVRILADRVGALDRAWLVVLSRLAAPGWLDRLLRGLTHAGGARATIGFSLLLLALPGTRALGAATALANLASHLAVQALKRSVVRRRPHLYGDFDPLAAVPDAFSFPSGHTAAITAVVFPPILAGHPLGLVLLPLVPVVAVSRVYLRVHYLTDVLAGFVLGLAGALLFT